MLDRLNFADSLGSDNHAGVHPKIMQALLDVNRGSAHAYGMDEVSELLRAEFERLFGSDVEAHLVFNGTAANVLCLSTLTRSFEAIICSDMAHLHVDECGAPEKFLGAKLLTLPTRDGKISPEQAETYLQRGGDQHYSQPRAVSLTQPTEMGVCYTLEELKAWRKFCDAHGLHLHIDGARLANAAVSLNASFADVVRGADAVSFGGTKNGLMGAEACLLFSKKSKEGFKFLRKQGMQLPSKTRFLAAQFYAYLHGDLWREIAEHSTRTARSLAERLQAFEELKLAAPVESNAVFVHVPKAWIKPLREQFFFYVWDNNTQLCRWMIGFDWTEQKTESLLKAIREVQKCSLAK